ncbi:META domain-containing protein [Nocardia lijiangensis]|uniref:META domain-containing protein n=1 Tax=Nocardia lijiangensis TaxID=299618 RepID=UPI00082AAFA8|nr:META domain-containing protein [Nocardia lijiangensis]
MSFSLVRFAPVLLLAFALAACSSGDDSGPAEPAATPMGRTFLSTEVQGQAIPGGGPLTLQFADGRVTANAGCNTISGAVTFDDNVLRVEELASTLIGCPGELADADRWVDTLLNSAPTWKLDGDTLTLQNNEQTVTLLDKKVARPDKPLRGTTWVVNGLITPDAHVRSQAIDDAKPTLVIAEDGAVSGSAGCNRLTGTATVEPGQDGEKVTFRLGTTKMMCPPEVMEVETAVLRALDGTTTATIDADVLTLRNDNGHGLTLTAR